MKYKIVLGVIGALVIFQGTMAAPDVGGKKRLHVTGCSNCHMAGASGHARELTRVEMDQDAPRDEKHSLSEAELGRLRVDRAADDVYRTDMPDPEHARILRAQEKA